MLVYLPSAASDAITIRHLGQMPFSLDIGPAIVAIVVWVVAFLALADLSLVRRDA